MLQQTGVSTVIPYFERWMRRFPTISALAQATEEEMLSHWQGLGYYRRGRNLWTAAKEMSSLPETHEEWLKVRGVGSYTAGAIASIALGEAVPLVDGNVERVYSRLCNDAASGTALNRAAWQWATAELRHGCAGDWNQALMELGATVCKPKNPLCSECPLQQVCVAFNQGTQNELPIKTAKTKSVELHFAVWIPIYNNTFGLRQISPGQWWEGMWEFPKGAVAADTYVHGDLAQLLGDGWRKELPRLRHVVTHHKISLYPSVLHLNEPVDDLRWFTREELETLPLPSAQRKLLRQV